MLSLQQLLDTLVCLRGEPLRCEQGVPLMMMARKKGRNRTRGVRPLGGESGREWAQKSCTLLAIAVRATPSLSSCPSP